MSNSPSTTEPSFQFAAITPHDTNLLTYNGTKKKCRAIYIGSIAGGTTMTVKDEDGNSVQFSGLVAGSIIPISTDRVLSTGTAAASLIALF
jgi:hypothetical protein